LSGPIAAALMANAADLLAEPPLICFRNSGPFRELVFGVVIRLGFQDHSES